MVNVKGVFSVCLAHIKKKKKKVDKPQNFSRTGAICTTMVPCTLLKRTINLHLGFFTINTIQWLTFNYAALTYFPTTMFGASIFTQIFFFFAVFFLGGLSLCNGNFFVCLS